MALARRPPYSREMSEVVFLGNLVATKDAHARAAQPPFIGLMAALDENGESWAYKEFRLAELSVEENVYDVASGAWRLRLMFHDDDWHDAKHDTLTAFLDPLAKDGVTGVVFAYFAFMTCSLWHLHDGSVTLSDLDPDRFPTNVRDLVEAESWHAAGDAVLEWCVGRS